VFINTEGIIARLSNDAMTVLKAEQVGSADLLSDVPRLRLSPAVLTALISVGRVMLGSAPVVLESIPRGAYAERLRGRQRWVRSAPHHMRSSPIHVRNPH
jgi:hypothetical protein